MLRWISTYSPVMGRDTLSEAMVRFGQWWLHEFLNFLPQRAADCLRGRGRNALVVTAEHGEGFLQLMSSARQELASIRINRDILTIPAIDNFLDSQGLDRRSIEIGIRLPSEKFFERSFFLPREAAGSLADAALQDLKAKTPFRMDDIYHGYSTSGDVVDGKLTITQWIIRKDFVGEALARLGLDLDTVSFIERCNEMDANATPARIALRPDHDDGNRSWPRKAIWILGVSTILAAAASAGSTYWRQQSMIDELAIQVAASRSKAQQVRSEFDKLDQKQGGISRLRRQRTGRPTVLEIWDEATRVLPAHSWLTELRVSELPQKQDQQIAMSGFSTAASSLIGTMTQSPLFFDVSPTSAITVDPVESRERFGLQAKIRLSKPSAVTP